MMLNYYIYTEIKQGKELFETIFEGSYLPIIRSIALGIIQVNMVYSYAYQKRLLIL